MRECGEIGLLLELADNGAVHRWSEALRGARVPGVVEIIGGLGSVLVVIDPAVTSLAEVRTTLPGLGIPERDPEPTSTHLIEVRYDGPDLEHIAHTTGMSPADVVTAHTQQPWQVAFCGFAPGFAYLVGGDPRLRVARRDESRVRVPAGAVAIAGEFSAVYPRASPGGWQLLGHTDVQLWNPRSSPPVLLRPGDMVEFRALR